MVECLSQQNTALLLSKKKKNKKTRKLSRPKKNVNFSKEQPTENKNTQQAKRTTIQQIPGEIHNAQISTHNEKNEAICCFLFSLSLSLSRKRTSTELDIFLGSRGNPNQRTFLEASKISKATTSPAATLLPPALFRFHSLHHTHTHLSTLHRTHPSLIENKSCEN